VNKLNGAEVKTQSMLAASDDIKAVTEQSSKLEINSKQCTN